MEEHGAAKSGSTQPVNEQTTKHCEIKQNQGHGAEVDFFLKPISR